MKRVFIVNPIAGNGKALKISKVLEIVCQTEKIQHEIIYTTGPGNATAIAREKSLNNDEIIIYSVGGDGTLNEVLNGIIDSNAILGVIPGGSGNDFYKMIKINSYLCNKIDVGKVNERYFINIASLGLDAKIAKRANNIKSKYLPNFLIYYLSIFGELINLDNIEIKIDNQTVKEKVMLLSICNGSYYGGGIKIAPSAIIDDGLFEIYKGSKVNRLQTLKLLIMLLKGKHEKSKFVEYWRTNGITVESSIPIICNVDGEIIEDKKFNFEIIENGINLLSADHPKIMELHKKGFK